MADKKQEDMPMPEIDLSEIKNLDAAVKKDAATRNLAENLSNNTVNRKRKDSRFNFTQSELVPLPSGGRLYSSVTEDQDVLNGFIRLFPMTVKEEEILSSQKHIRTGATTRLILENCIDSAINAKDILVFDSNFLLFYLRKISYGDEYEFEIESTADSLRRKFNHTIKISELAFEELDSSIKEPIKIVLPVSKYTVEFVLPRMFHIEEVYKLNSKRKKGKEIEDKRFIDNLLVTTIRILDDKKQEVEDRYWEEFFEALPGKDIADLRDATRFDTGVDEISGLFCPYTGRELDIVIPMGPEFFRF